MRHEAGLGLRSVGLVRSNDAFGMALLSALNKTMNALQLTTAVIATTPSFTSSEIQGHGEGGNRSPPAASGGLGGNATARWCWWSAPGLTRSSCASMRSGVNQALQEGDE